MKNCFDEGTIQAFLDGELASDLLENVARHVAVCDGCALLMAEAEEESAFAFSALEQEFNTLVPTQRLWTKINDSIVRERKSVWQTVFAFFKHPT
ncbi:MAG: anti-sigma factor family protein, partial [Pyrinomonadaceae bacterium]